SLASAPTRKAIGNGTSIGWMGWPPIAAVLGTPLLKSSAMALHLRPWALDAVRPRRQPSRPPPVYAPQRLLPGDVLLPEPSFPLVEAWPICSRICRAMFCACSSLFASHSRSASSTLAPKDCFACGLAESCPLICAI